MPQLAVRIINPNFRLPCSDKRAYLVERHLAEDKIEAGYRFDEHTSYLVGDYLLDAKTKRLVAVFSTDNLLLNGYRVKRGGLPIQLCVDTTWRLIVENHGTILMGVVDLAQKFHVLAYAVVSKEDKAGHVHCFKMLKLGVRDVVQLYAQKKWSC